MKVFRGNDDNICLFCQSMNMARSTAQLLGSACPSDYKRPAQKHIEAGQDGPRLHYPTTTNAHPQQFCSAMGELARLIGELLIRNVGSLKKPLVIPLADHDRDHGQPLVFTPRSQPGIASFVASYSQSTQGPPAWRKCPKSEPGRGLWATTKFGPATSSTRRASCLMYGPIAAV